jgi:mannose-1-phosphate guanylyltransferase
MEHTYAVVMAGGSGTRLWPVSRKKHPKHTLPLLGERTLFQSTLERLDGFIPTERVMVVTAADQAAELQQQAPQIPVENFIVEPEPRGTASVIGLAAVVLQLRDPQAVMLVLPSDHFIGNRDLFHLVLRVAVQVARKGYLVTLGITPTFPSPAYGYIQRGAALAEKFDYPVYSVQRFTEKPTEREALELMAAGDASWNSGMFIWRVEKILGELAELMPELTKVIDEIGAAWDSPRRAALLQSCWPNLKVETIDYAVMERTRDLAVLPAGGLEWSDVGSWDSLFNLVLPRESGNVVVSGKTLLMDSHKTLILAGENKLVVGIGLDDLIIVDTPDALLVCHREQAQRVRQVIDRLKDSHQDSYL